MGRFESCFHNATPHTASSVFLSSHMAGPGGYFVSIFGQQTIRKYPKEGEHAAMQDSARQDILFFLDTIRSLSVSFVLRIWTIFLRFCHDYTHHLTADRWLDVSFVFDGVLEYWVMKDCIGMDIYGLESACGFSVEHACVLTTDGTRYDNIRRYKPLRCAITV